MRPSYPINWWNVALLFCLVGEALVLLGAVLAVLKSRHDHRVAGFVETKAQVFAVKLLKRRSRRGTSYTPLVLYRYWVEGRELTASSDGMGSAATEVDARRDFEARYPVGSERTAYYNPDEPSESVLYRDPPPTTELMLLMSGCLGVPFLLLLPGSVLAVVRIVRLLRTGRWGRPPPPDAAPTAT